MKTPMVCSLSMLRYYDMGGLEEDKGQNSTSSSFRSVTVKK